MKTHRRRFTWMLGMSLTAFMLAAKPAAAVPVDLEIILMVDVSFSVSNSGSPSEFELQRQGYVDAFNNAAIYNAIANGGTHHAIAVSLVYWSDGQVQAIDWTLITGEASSQAFATTLAGTPRPPNDAPPAGVGTQTALGDAIVFSYPLFDNNGFEGTRLVIDVSGDGATNAGQNSSSEARDAALAAGVSTINGITITDEQAVIDHYLTQVIGGVDAFHINTLTFEGFSQAIQQKLLLEIQGPGNGNGPVVPEPSTVMLMGIGIAGAFLRRKLLSVYA